MGLLDLLQQGYQKYKQSDTPVATLLRNKPKNFIPSVARNLDQQLSLLQTPEGVLDLVNPVSKIGGLLGSINMGNKSFSQFSPKAVMAFKQANDIPKPKRISSRPIPNEIIKERNALIDGTITNSEYYAKQNKLYPFTYFKEVPKLTNVFDIGKALKHSKLPSEEAIKGQVKGGRAILGLGASIDDGTKITSRLDIDAYDIYNVWSASIRGATKAGKDKVKLKGSAQKSLKIAEGGGKSPFAVMDGYWKANSPETIRELAVKYIDNPEWVQVAFNPTKSGHFMDKIKGIPVTEADEVIQIGPLVLGKNVKYDLNLQPFSK